MHLLPGRITVVPVFALLLILVVPTFVWSLWRVTHQQADRIRALSHATFLFTIHDQKEAELASLLSQVKGMTVVAVESDGAAKRVFEATGNNSVSVPLLVVPIKQTKEYYSGMFSITSALNPILQSSSYFTEGGKAIMVIGGLTFAAIFMAAELATLIAYLPIAGLGALAIVVGNCLTCNVGGTRFSSIFPALGAIYICVGLFLFTVRHGFPRRPTAAFAACSIAIPLVQMVALTIEPKFCLACLTVSAVAVSYYVALGVRLSGQQCSRLLVPDFLKPVLIAAAFIIIARDALGLTGIVTFEHPKDIALPSLVGHRISEYVTGKDASGLILVTLSGCEECEAAKSSFATSHTHYHEVPLCMLKGQDGCITIGDEPFPVPLILVCDQTGRITYQRNGWTTHQGEAALTFEIQNAILRNKS